VGLMLEYCYPPHMLRGLFTVLCFCPACNTLNSNKWIYLELIYVCLNLAAPVFPLIC
jgi:hypothetical protein